jgi:hypothetical protein
MVTWRGACLPGRGLPVVSRWRSSLLAVRKYDVRAAVDEAGIGVQVAPGGIYETAHRALILT